MSSSNHDIERDLLHLRPNLSPDGFPDSESLPGRSSDGPSSALDALSTIEGEGAVDSEQDVGSDEDDERENRFVGPSSTWRSLTADERGLAASLDQQQANDLSIHLYNAHALKVRVRDPDVAATVKFYENKKRWINSNTDGSMPWHPDTAWTSWPMSANDVPRKAEQFGVHLPSKQDESATFKRVEAWRPSADLEEEIKALFLKRAKEQIQMQERQRSSGTNGVSVLTDEDDADALLTPTARHILSQVDDLLLGLQKSRHGQIRDASGSRRRKSRSQSKSQSQAQSQSQSQSKSQSQTKTRASSNASDESTLDPDNTDSETQANVVRPSKKARRNTALNPRDWSEVLGMASLVGWNADAVSRAAARCTSLFGEGMTFTTTQSNGDDGRPTETQTASENNAPARPTVSWYRCPVNTCERHIRPYDTVSRWREHLEEVHDFRDEQIDGVEESSKTVTQV